jgi:hypothetical protein
VTRERIARIACQTERGFDWKKINFPLTQIVKIFSGTVIATNDAAIRTDFAINAPSVGGHARCSAAAA